MPKLSKNDAAKKRAQAKELFVKGISLDTLFLISERLDVPLEKLFEDV